MKLSIPGMWTWLRRRATALLGLFKKLRIPFNGTWLRRPRQAALGVFKRLRIPFNWTSLRRQLKAAVPFFASLVFHVAAVVVLSLILFPILSAGTSGVLSLSRR